MSRDALEFLQLERLQATLNRVVKSVPLYRQRFRELRLDPYDIQCLEDIRHIPFTTKEDIRNNYPYGMFAVPLRDVVRMQTSPGFTGTPIVIGYTARDVLRWSDMAARILAASGVTENDVVQIFGNYSLLSGAFGMHYGSERMGASVIPSGLDDVRRQIQIMLDYRTTTIVCTPSYALHIANFLDNIGINRNALCLRHGIFGGEPWGEDIRLEIQERLGIIASDHYGLSEITAVAGECVQHQGLHVNEDYVLAEVVDPHSGEPVPLGEWGELVLTTLAREAFPLIRFRTGDLTVLYDDPCPCGRTFRRMGRIPGRSDDMFIVGGVNVFPAQIHSIMLSSGLDGARYQIVLERVEYLDRATVLVEAPESFCTDSIKKSQRIIENLRLRLHTQLGVPFGVRLVEPRTIASNAPLVDDRR
jgi:phenylacetate-CoA ligase